MKLTVVPVEPTTEMRLAAFDAISDVPRGSTRRFHMDKPYAAFLAAAPALPPEVQEAVELAKEQLAHFSGPKYEKESKIARALLEVTGSAGDIASGRYAEILREIHPMTELTDEAKIARALLKVNEEGENAKMRETEDELIKARELLCRIRSSINTNGELSVLCMQDVDAFLAGSDD